MQRLSRERRTVVEQRREGFTLLEILIVAGLLTVTLGSAMNVWFHSQAAFTESVRQNVVSTTGQRILARLGSGFGASQTGYAVPSGRFKGCPITATTYFGIPAKAITAVLEAEAKAKELATAPINR